MPRIHDSHPRASDGVPPASIVIPTRARLAYLDAALASIVPQAADLGVDVLVVHDGQTSLPARGLTLRNGARYLALATLGTRRGLNVARNAGVAATAGELVVFVDDDIRARPGWLAAILAAARELPATDVFTGPVRVRLEGPAPRSCGREGPPITALDLGTGDTDARYAWGANMAFRRTALRRAGPFDESLHDAGDEQELQDHLRASGSPAPRYVAAAAVDHRRAGDDARLRALARAGFVRGRAARRFDAWRGEAPSTARELVTLAGCAWHVLRRRCPAGLVMVAHSAGRLQAAREPAPARQPAAGREGPADRTPADDFLSGTSGTVGGLDAVRRGAADAALTTFDIVSGRRIRLARAARTSPPSRRVLALTLARPHHAASVRAIGAELHRSRHALNWQAAPPGGRGKFESLNALLVVHDPRDYDWLLVIDDDVTLPRGFADDFLFLCERFDLALAQPAHRLRSHAAWQVTRRQTGSAVRETAFVEIGPVTAFARRTFDLLLPFPSLRMGWGLDLHWAALARSHGWRCGVVDAVAVAHAHAPAAAAYSREAAIAEARTFLADRPYLPAGEAGRTLITHRRW